MEIRELEYFLAVVDNGGVAGASAALSVAPTAVAETISRLEMELRTRLFFRLDTGMRPSSAGWALIGPARRTVRAARALTARTDTAPVDLAGSVIFGVFAPLAGEVLADLVIRLREQYPRVRVRVVGIDWQDDGAAAHLASGRIDFLLMHVPVADESLAQIVLGRHEVVVVYPPGAEVPPGPVDLSDLPPFPLVLAPMNAYAFEMELAAMLTASGRRPPIAVIMEPREGWVPLVEAGVCGAIFERSQVIDLPDDVEVHPVSQQVDRVYGLVYDPNRLDATGRAVVRLARAHAAAHAGRRPQPT
jgi:DNA-binding transcriptional LysR family regulator